MNLEQAQLRAYGAAPVHYSTNGGRKRYLRFTRAIEGPAVFAHIYGTTIAVFNPSGIRLYSAGHAHSITTREAMNYCLSMQGFVHSRDNVIYAGDQEFTDGMCIPYKGDK